jgi:tRNA nucleotidyltransferase (CCA-adding enzyme)
MGRIALTSALSPETWPFSIDLLPPEAHLVGGAVRDALLERQSDYLDLDFVLPTDAVQTARQLANRTSAGFVVLDAERQIARVVFAEATVDFALQEGDSLEVDLQRRDFTINAIAYNPHTQEIIDPLQGMKDLQAGVMRMVSRKNLQDDPLRLLRAYRQAAQLGFQIEGETRETIRQLAPLLGQVAAERVQVELGYLLKSPQGTPWLKAAWQDNLLPVWFPNATSEGVEQIAGVDCAAATLCQTWPPLYEELQGTVGGQSLSRLSLAKLACLLPPQPEAAQEQLLALKYSRAEVRTVGIAIAHLSELRRHADSPLSLREQYFFFQTVGSVFPMLVVLAVAQGMATEAVAPLVNRYLNPNDQVAHPTPLVTGNDLMQALNLRSGPQIGQLLTEIQLARIEGKVASTEEALHFAARMVTE